MTESTVLDLLREIGRIAKRDFSGLGLIFYSGELTLPILSLRGSKQFVQILPILERGEIVKTLAEISSTSSDWHDGFHLLNCDILALTHVAQFVAPPLRKVQSGIYPETRGGARHMTAALSSLCSEVCYAAMLTSDGVAAVYRNGYCVREEGLRT